VAGKTVPGTVEVWLSWINAEMDIRVRYVRPDESTREEIAESVSMRGAQREVSGQMIDRGWQPVSRWITERDEGGEALECYRTFRPGPDAEPL
jgi:hypothetical protein